jgi:hypothetical protein
LLCSKSKRAAKKRGFCRIRDLQDEGTRSFYLGKQPKRSSTWAKWKNVFRNIFFSGYYEYGQLNSKLHFTYNNKGMNRGAHLPR